MMTQTKHKIFNNKIKMLLLILIWTLIWRRGCIAHKMVKAAEVVEDGNGEFDGYGVTMATTTVDDSNNDDDGNDDHDGVVVDDSVELEVQAKEPKNAIYGRNDSRVLNGKNDDKQDNAVQTALNDQLTNNNNDENDVDDAMDNSMINNDDGNENKQLNADINVVVSDDVAVTGDDDNDNADGDDELNADKVDATKTTASTILPTSDEHGANNILDDVNILTEAEMSVMLKQKLIYDFAIKYKQIPRITYFTCKAGPFDNNSNKNNNNNDQRKMDTMKILQGVYKLEGTAATTASTSSASGSNKNNNNNNSKAKSSNNGYNSNFLNINNTTQADPKGILIKLVQIDQLINKRRSNNNNSNRRSSGVSSSSSYGRNVNVAEAGINAGYGFGGYERGGRAMPGGRNSYTNANWLEGVLRSDRLRQIVVLDLGCGAASRKLIEMASNKELFSTAFHWLLIEEDYAVNRQTPINDNNNNNMNNNNMNNNNNAEYENARYAQPVANVSQYDENSNKNNSSNNVNNVKKSNITGAATAAVMAAATNIHSKTVANRFIAKLLQYNGEYVVGNRSEQQQQQRLQQRLRFSSNDVAASSISTSSSFVVDDEENMEIIEKFLQKINFNINTELILAKRIRQGGNAAIVAEAGSSVPVAGLGYTSNKILQKKDYYMLHDVWNPGLQYGGQLNISEIGSFTLDDGLQIAPWYRRSTTITRRMDMKNARIRCLIVITHKNRTDTLEEYLSTHYDTHLDSMNRFNFALLAHVRDLYNFSFILSKTSSWGYLKNGKFDGMIGALTRKQADIGGSPIFFRIERAKVIDYTARTWVARPCFIFRHPRSTKKDRIVFLQPFSNDVWIFTAMCGIITILLLWSLTNIERKIGPDAVAVDGKNLPLVLPKNYSVSTRTTTTTTTTRGRRIARNHNAIQTITAIASSSSSSLKVANNLRLAADGQIGNKNNHNKSNNQTLATSKQTAVIAGHDFKEVLVRWGNIFCGQDGDDASRRRVGLFLESVLFYIGSICQQGLAFSTSFFSGRCIVTTSLLFSFAIYQFYSASIVGTLLMEKPKTIRTLRDLIHSSLEIGIEDIVYNRDYFLRTKDPDAIELYAKKVTAVPTNSEQGYLELPPDEPATTTPASSAAMAKSYREILHSHETGAHAKTNEASNWYDPEYGVSKIQKGRFAFHVDVATAYKIISDTFNEKEICDLTEIQLFPPQKMVSIVQKGSPLRKMITYGLRRVTEVGLMDYQRKVWHSPKPRCVKQIHTDDLRVDMQTFTSALLVLIFGFAVSLLALGLEIMHHKLWQRYVVEAFEAQCEEEEEEEEE